jgi:hypothetical protein
VIYAISLVTTSGRFASQGEEFRRELIATKAAIEHTLGGCGPDAAVAPPQAEAIGR